MALSKPQLRAKFEVASLSRYRNIKKPQNLGSSPSRSHAYVFLWYDFVMDPGKPQLLAKFEVANLNRCRNNKGKPPKFAKLLSSGPLPRFPLGVIL